MLLAAFLISPGDCCRHDYQFCCCYEECPEGCRSCSLVLCPSCQLFCAPVV